MTVAILGAGWLGLPLGRALVAAGHTVQGATTTSAKLEELRDAGLQPFLITVTSDGIEGADVARFFQADALVITLPPGRGTPDVERRFRALMERVYAAASAVSHAVYTSSTSVYPDLVGAPMLTEADAGHSRDERLRPSGRACVTGENGLFHSFAEATVLRLGGLYGPGRSPARYLAGRTDLARGDQPVNLVHRDDVVDALVQVLEGRVGGTYNLVADEHPARRDFYPAAACALGLDPPTFVQNEDTVRGKRISNAYAKETLGVTFRPLDPAFHREDTEPD